jgi:hypothetical protein
LHTRVLIVLALGVVASHARAQAADAHKDLDHWGIGISLGMPGYRRNVNADFMTFGLSFTQLHPGRLGADIAVGTMPKFVQNGLAPIGLRADLTFPLAPAKHLVLLPAAGFSAIGVIGSGGAGAVAGPNAGLATVLYSGEVGLRTGITFHSFHRMDGPVWLFEVGFVAIGTDIK